MIRLAANLLRSIFSPEKPTSKTIPEPRIHRVTLFKLPDPEAQRKLLDAYETLGKTQSKVGSDHLPPLLSSCRSIFSLSLGFETGTAALFVIYSPC
jgi:hypothetical protein